jgi:gluconate 2-dehydrogenase gamma chain
MRTRKRSLTRRRFFQVALTATAAGSLVSCSRPGGGPYWRFFTAAEAKTADAICEQIIPADDAPGASQAGVVRFIDLQLTKHYKKHQAAYRKGIAAVDDSSRSRFKKAFVELSAAEQTEVLMDLESNDDAFFALIRTHTMQGFYGDSRHGGNAGAVSWRMLGLPTPPVRGRVPYERKVG